MSKSTYNKMTKEQRQAYNKARYLRERERRLKYASEWRNSTRKPKMIHIRKALQRLAKIKGCSYCGTHNDIQYHWHHNQGIMNFRMSDSWQYSKKRRHAELKLTIPICCNCHSKHHMKDRKRDKKGRFLPNYP